MSSTNTNSAQTAGGKIIKAPTVDRRMAAHPYHNHNLTPVESKSDWAIGVAFAHASDKDLQAEVIERQSAQLGAISQALVKAAGMTALKEAKAVGDATFQMNKMLKGGLEAPVDDDDVEVVDYGASTGEVVVAKKKGGGRPKGFGFKTSYIFFMQALQKSIKEDPEAKKVLMDRYSWDGTTWSSKDKSTVTIMTVAAGEWAVLRDATDEASKELMAAYNEKAATFKVAAEAALDRYNELLKTDENAAKEFRDERMAEQAAAKAA